MRPDESTLNAEDNERPSPSSSTQQLPLLVSPLQDRAAIRGKHCTLRARVSSSCEAIIEWRKNDEPLSPSLDISAYSRDAQRSHHVYRRHRRRVTTSQNGDEHSLRFEQIEGGDAAAYTLIVSNICGSARTSCFLIVAEQHGADAHLVSVADEREAPSGELRFIERPPEELRVREGSPFELVARCIAASSTSSIGYTWSKGGRELSGRLQSAAYETRRLATGASSLRVAAAVVRSGGVFEVVATADDGGQAYAMTLVVVTRRRRLRAARSALAKS